MMGKSNFETGPKRETGSHLKVPYPLPKAQKDTGFNGFLKILFFEEKDNKKGGPRREQMLWSPGVAHDLPDGPGVSAGEPTRGDRRRRGGSVQANRVKKVISACCL